MARAERSGPSGAAAALARRVVLPLLWSAPALGKDLGGGWTEKKNEDGKVVQQLKIEAPSFTEEDQYGYVMPDRYRCDSCKAVMFHLDRDLRKKQPKSRRLKQWEFTDVFDDTCRGSFDGYGIRLIDGENTLSGPGLKQPDTLAPGSGAIQMGGESWSKRLGEICRKLVYEKLGEDELYERFWERFSAQADGADEASGPGLGEDICATELRECIVGPRPPAKAKKEAAEKKEKKEKKEKAKAKKPKASPAASSSSSPRAPPAAPPAAAPAAGERVGAEAFLRDLAVRHGLTPEEYLSARTVGEWERLSIAIAGRLFNSMSTSAGSGSCSADSRSN